MKTERDLARQAIEADNGYDDYTDEEKQRLEWRINHLPVSGLMYQVFLFITLGLLTDGLDVYLAGSVLGQLIQSGWSSLQLNAVFISTTFIGLFIGSIATGIVGDRRGRKFAYQINLLIFGLASLASFFAVNMTMLIVLRGISGIGLGAEIVTGFAMLGEFAPASSRGRWVAAVSLISNCSAPLATFLGFLIIPTIGWRWMFAAVGAFALLVWYFRRAMPESPRWYFSQGRYAEAEKIVRRFERRAASSSVVPASSPHTAPLATHVGRGKFSDLFTRHTVKTTVLACVILAALNTVAYTFVTWVPTLLVKSGITVSSSLGYATLMMMGAPVGALIGMLLVDHVGRKKMIIGGFVLTACFGYTYALQTNPVSITIIGFLLSVCIYTLMAVGLAVYVPELFPTCLRMRGNSVAQATGRLFTIGTPYLVAWLLRTQSVISIFVFTGLFMALAAVLTFFCGEETRQKVLK
ncbi:MAG: MFS transporter [Sporolactobacillus sp.]